MRSNARIKCGESARIERAPCSFWRFVMAWWKERWKREKEGKEESRRGRE